MKPKKKLKSMIEENINLTKKKKTRNSITIKKLRKQRFQTTE